MSKKKKEKKRKKKKKKVLRIRSFRARNYSTATTAPFASNRSRFESRRREGGWGRDSDGGNQEERWRIRGISRCHVVFYERSSEDTSNLRYDVPDETVAMHAPVIIIIIYLSKHRNKFLFRYKLEKITNYIKSE